MSQNRSLSSYLQYGTHYIAPGGDPRSLNLPTSGTPAYSYLKMATGQGKSFLGMQLSNLDDTGKSTGVATFSYAVINQDVALYGLAANASPNLQPAFQAPSWTPAPFGSSGTVRVVPGGTLWQELNIATTGDAAQDTLVVRILLTGASLKIETWGEGAVDEY